MTDSEGNIWATSGGTLLLKLSYKDGILGQSVEADSAGRLWAGTEDGLYFIDTDGSVSRVPKELGFPSDIYGEHVSCTLGTVHWPFLLGYLLLLSAIVYTVMKLRERRLLVKELDMRNRLLFIISHDIRGPVSGNYILSRELLEKVDGLSRVQLKEALAELSASAENASSLLENLLLWSLSQKGMLKPVMREVNLLGVAKEAVGSVRGQDVITVDIPENLIVRTDRNMLLTAHLQNPVFEIE